MSRDSNRPGLVLWTGLVVASIGLFAFANSWDGPYGSMGLVFAIAVPMAAVCVFGSVALLTVAWRDDNGELGLFSLFFAMVSILPLIHAITIPGVLYDDNATTVATGILAVPLGLSAAWPLLAPRSALSARLGRRWRPWTVGWLVAAGIGALTTLTFPDLPPLVDPSSTSGAILGLLSLAGLLWMSFGHLRLYWLSRSALSFSAAAGMVVLAASVLGWIFSAPLGLSFWLSHVFDVSGVLLGTMAGLLCYRQGNDLRVALRPIVALDPLVSLELGLDPLVHSFVADLQRKDQITRDHVVRVGELTGRVGEKAGLSPTRMRHLAAAAVLHDIGKLEVPDEVLGKPGKLTDSEYELIKTHAAIGGDLLAGSPALAAAAPFVRSHHERPDGRGYPDGLSSDDLPLEVRIIGACDAFDAIAHSRQYREGKGAEFALGVLREHAGTQFDPQVIAWLADVVGTGPDTLEPSAFAEIGQAVCDDCARLSL